MGMDRTEVATGVDAGESSERDREIVVERDLPASPARVFVAFTDPVQVTRWWGPEGFRTTTHETDVRPGGVWRFTMHGPDGVDYPNRVVFREVVEPERLVYTHDDDTDGEDALRFETTVTFEPIEGGTRIRLRTVFPTAAMREHVVREHRALEGAEQTLGRLARHLADGDAASDAPGVMLELTRHLDSPVDVVYRAWTEAERFARWFGPHGSTVEACRLDPRPGGSLHFLHRVPEVWDVWIRGTYREVVAGERLVFTVGFADEAGNVVERPGFPHETLITVTFAPRDDGTLLTVRHTGLVVDQGESQGWSEGLDRLAGLLAA
jgi:uncharacterized protein YndB with AHSA1/START domain